MDYREFIQLDLPVAVAIVSCGADWRVEEANAEFTDVLGYTEKELRETRPQKMVYDEDYANLVSVLENVVRTHDNGKMQLRIVRPDGKTRWVEMRCSVLAHYDVKPYVVLFLWDIDEICLFENIDVVGNRGCREGERLCNFQNVHGLFGKNS